ncbi:MAG: two pore domain potassium channel family protein [Gammaproteobacteria bacterium]|nr:two pore domain potassium channel family protein [Gammaproteobacteria bacterium]
MVQAWVINGLLIAVAVVIHYEILRLLSVVIPTWPIQHRMKVVVGLLGALTAHVIEIWVFGIGFYLLVTNPEFGNLVGNYEHSLLDSVYFSFVMYTSLGIGDIVPVGIMRFLAGLETLTGLVLITWTASFMYIEMQRFWERR